MAIGVRRSAFGEARVPYPLKSRVAISRFNKNCRSEKGQVARDPRRSGIRCLGFSTPKKNRTVDSQSVKSRGDVVAWDPKERAEYRWLHIRESGPRCSGFENSEG
jgi:hypothetical protein